MYIFAAGRIRGEKCTHISNMYVPIIEVMYDNGDDGSTVFTRGDAEPSF
jgi:hypothetical protein